MIRDIMDDKVTLRDCGFKSRSCTDGQPSWPIHPHTCASVHKEHNSVQCNKRLDNGTLWNVCDLPTVTMDANEMVTSVTPVHCRV